MASRNPQRHFKRLSLRARRLLSLGEGQEVDYKSDARGLEPADLVAFANSRTGGTILIGVGESEAANGTQIGVPMGCPIGDEARLQILGKAQSCSPPIAVDIFIENLSIKPFFRLEITSSPTKPHSTNRGTYVVREDGRNAALLPTVLLRMFLESEAEIFGSRFRETTEELTRHADQTLSHVRQMETQIAEKIEEMGSTLGWADFKVGDTADTMERVEAYVHSILKRSTNESDRLRAIVAKIGADDPVKKRAKDGAVASIKKQLLDEPKLMATHQSGDTLQLRYSGEIAEELSQEELKEAFAIAAQELLKDVQDEMRRRTEQKKGAKKER